MELAFASPSVVRSIKQRDLLRTWTSLFVRRNLPPKVEDFRPDRFDDELPDIFVCAVQYRGDTPRIVIAADSKRMHPAFGPSGIGQTLDEYIGPSIGPLLVPLYVECIRLQRPIYTVWKLADVDGRAVNYERLLMPFSDGQRITSIFASLKGISEDGHFNVIGMMRQKQSPPTIVLQAVIDCSTIAPVTKKPAADEIEFN